MIRFKSKICKILNHKWKYNFAWMPNKRKCKRCGKYQEMTFQKGKDPITEPEEYMLWEDADYSISKTEL